MADRWRPQARPDPDASATDASQRAVITIGSSDDEDAEANEDLSLAIVAKARRREAERRNPEFVSLLSSSSEEEGDADADAVVEVAEEDRKKRKPRRRKPRKRKQQQQQQQEKVAVEEVMIAEKEEPQVGGTKEEQLGLSESVLTEEGNTVCDNVVLRKLLRGPRYFDPGESILDTCFNCGEEGHLAANCTMEKRKKPCFVCGLFGHNSKQCTQGQDCYICKRKGHIAKDCPDKHNRNSQHSTICLRCGDTGHDMFGCTNDYPADDMKDIQCYICKHHGHLCCADFTNNSPKEVSCYNCAQSGHTGLGCAKPRGENSTVASSTLCYKCGKEGHFARGCTKNTKSSTRSMGESSTPNWKRAKGNRESLGFRSAPCHTRKVSKKKNPPYEERTDIPHVKSRVRGGWIVDDPDDLPTKKYKANARASPSTPSTQKRHYVNNYLSYDGNYSSPPSSKKQKCAFASPSSNFLSGARKHGFSTPRFANSHIRVGRA